MAAKFIEPMWEIKIHFKKSIINYYNILTNGPVRIYDLSNYILDQKITSWYGSRISNAQIGNTINVCLLLFFVYHAKIRPKHVRI